MKEHTNPLMEQTTGRTEYQTDNFTLLSYLNFNRDVTEARMKTIAGSIKRVGQQEPGIISEEGKILSGQGRFEACKYLNIPYKYIIGDIDATNDDETVEIMLEIHKVQSTFTPNETLECYCDLKRDDYLWLRNLKRTYNLAVNNLLMVIATGWDKNHTLGVAFKSGKLKVSQIERERVEADLKWIESIDEAHPFQTKNRTGAFGNKFLKCIMSAMKWHKDIPGLKGQQIHTFDRKRFLTQVEAHRMRLEVNTELQWEEIEFIYNKGKTKKNKFEFPPMSLLDSEMSPTYKSKMGNLNPTGKSKVIANGSLPTHF